MPLPPPHARLRTCRIPSKVLEARFEKVRLEKERAAVLSEMSMVNTIEYRVECAILQVPPGRARCQHRNAPRLPRILKSHSKRRSGSPRREQPLEAVPHRPEAAD